MTYPLNFRQKVFDVKKKYELTYEETSEVELMACATGMREAVLTQSARLQKRLDLLHFL